MKRIWVKPISLMLLVVMLITITTSAFTYDRSTENVSPGNKPTDYKALIVSSEELPLLGKTGSLPSLVLDGTQSSWAEAELKKAYEYGLTYPDITNNFKKTITREEFCTIAVKLYEKLTGKTADVGTNPFVDTNNPEILKAYTLKIVNGTTKDKFSPSNNITRQEICVMIFRALNVSLASLDKSPPAKFPFVDTKKIDSWAIDAMKFAYKNEIMKGTGNNEISPLNNTTREQAIVLLKRTYVKYSGAEESNAPILTPTVNSPLINGLEEVKATIPILTVIPPLANELEKFKKIESGRNLAFLEYDERLELFVSTEEYKPSSLPNHSPSNGGLTIAPSILPDLQLVNNDSFYTNSTFSAFIDKAGNTKRWFAYKLNNAPGASKIVWQVSKSPFSGFSDNWKTPIGLTGSGEVEASKGEFQIDFANLKVSVSNTLFYKLNLPLSLTSSYKPIPQKMCTYYVRAVPVDSVGNAIGEPGEGIEVIYGERIVAGNPASAVKPGFELWTPGIMGYCYKVDNAPTNLPHKTLDTSVDSRSNVCRLFHFHGLDDAYTQIVLQVSTDPFPALGGGWPETPDLIYEKSYSLPTTTYADANEGAYIDDMFPATVPVVFSEFGKPASEIKEGDYTKYYVRGAALKQSIEPGKYDIIYSDTITVNYGYSPPIKWYNDSPYDKTQKLSVSKPNIRMKNYTPVKWQNPDYMHHYYVFKTPTADEITCKWKNTVTGEVLYPYNTVYQIYYDALGIHSKADYQTKMIPKVLQIGTKVYIPPPKEEDKAWYEELFDGIVGFFEDLWKAIQAIVNQVSASYNNLKAGLINFVADLCPIESLKGAFKLALEGLVNYGLMCVGIPPALPNFDDLSEMSMDYFAEIALTEAGVPSNEITQGLVAEVAEGISTEIEKATNHEDYNPINSAFLKLDPDYLYLPAYVDVEIFNSTNVPSIAGSFSINVTFEMDYYNQLDPKYGLDLVVETNYIPGSAAALQAYADYSNHFRKGLNGNTVDYAHSGDIAVYDVFKPKVGVKVPILSPGESRSVRIYLEPFPKNSSFTRYPEGEGVRAIDFENMYFYNGDKKFTLFTLSGQFPSAEEYLMEQGDMIYLDPKTEYFFTDEHKTNAYDKIQQPVNSVWSK